MNERMKRLIRKLALYTMIVAGTLSCTGANLYKDLAANKTSDEALYVDAQKLLDSGDYTGAINKILATTSGFQAQSRVKESLAGAYAGRCGMEFLPFVSRLTSTSSSSFYNLAMGGFVGIDTANYADCVVAETIVEGIGAIGARTQSQNLFLLVLEMAKFGNILRKDGDILPTAVGDGTTDAGFDCRTSVPIADAQAVIESFIKFLSLFVVVGDTLGSGGSTTTISDFLADNPTIADTAFDYSGGGGAGVDELDPLIILSRSLIYSQDFGIGTCNNPDPTQCVCP